MLGVIAENDQQHDDIYGKLYNWYALIGDAIKIPKWYYVPNPDAEGDSNQIPINNYSSDDGVILSIGYEDSLTCKICPDGWRSPMKKTGLT